MSVKDILNGIAIGSTFGDGVITTFDDLLESPAITGAYSTSVINLMIDMLQVVDLIGLSNCENEELSYIYETGRGHCNLLFHGFFLNLIKCKISLDSIFIVDVVVGYTIDDLIAYDTYIL